MLPVPVSSSQWGYTLKEGTYLAALPFAVTGSNEALGFTLTIASK